jgi:hypothetical protein
LKLEKSRADFDVLVNGADAVKAFPFREVLLRGCQVAS